MSLLRVEQQLNKRVRHHLAMAGTLVIAHLGFCAHCAADFSSANFKRVWAEEFGLVGVPPSGGNSAIDRNLSGPAKAGTPTLAGTPTPHPAVARIVVPEGEAISFGSGTLVDVREGFGIVITNWHVVRDAKGPIEVIFPGGFTSKARVLKMDADWDLAALVIWQPPIEPVKIATMAPQPGDPLTICGYGPGIYRSATGHCTQYYAPREDFPQQMVELSVEARQGDSGGPIFNSRGELAGVLFGAGNGTTLGSFNGRVGEFLASLAPDIGQKTETALVSVSTFGQSLVPRETAGDQWRSAITEPAEERIEAETKTLLEPPAFEELYETKSDVVAPSDRFIERPTDNDLAASVFLKPSGQYNPSTFDKIKSGLAAFGLFAIVVMFLKAAG